MTTTNGGATLPGTMKTTRRAFLTASLVVLATPLAAEAQPAEKVRRVGYLTPFSLAGPTTQAFRQGLRDHGYIEGRNILVEYRTYGQDDERLPALAAELLKMRPDVVVAQTGVATAAVKALTATTPVVMAGSADAVASGLVQSLSRPGANVTGYTWLTPELVPKRLQILKEAVPDISRIVALGCAGPTTATQLDRARSAGRALDIAVEVVEYRGPSSWPETTAAIGKARPGALLLLDCPGLPFQVIAEFTLRSRLPTISPYAGVARFGSLLDYGPDPGTMTRSAAGFVKKILDGTKPADLPVEQPTRFNLVVNLTAARILGLTIPPSVLLRADEVIQ